jgi:hypothetical protein
MITAKLLCEFVANPFGDERKARELLSEIEGRDLSNAEIERGQFSFQVALHCLALLAIEANVADRSVRTTFLIQMEDRIRAFYARTASSVRFDDFIVSPDERDTINAVLRAESDMPEGGGASATNVTRLALFDLVNMRRLCEYHDAINRSKDGDGFRVLAQRVLYHYSGRTHHPVVVATIADLLAADYNIVSEIVTSGLAVIDTRRIEGECASPPLLLGPGMPELGDRQPIKAYSAGQYLLLLFANIAPIGRNSRLSFKYVLALCDKRDRLPVCFVTLENSSSISNVLCVFEQSGSHSNYGLVQGHNLLQEFMGKGVVLLADRFELGEIEEHPAPKASLATPGTDAFGVHCAA